MFHAPQPKPAELRPRRWWYWAGGLVILAGFVAGITGFAIGLVSALGMPELETRFHAGEEAVLQAGRANDDTRTWLLYADRPMTSSEVDDSCTIDGPDPDAAFDMANFSQETTSGDQTWVLAAAIDISEPGTYTIACAADSGAEFGVGYGDNGVRFATGLAGGLASFFLLPALGLVIGVPILIVTAVRRRSHRRRLMSGARPDAWGPGYGGPGYGG
ncbi:hypothetical protein CLV63_101431 [Murinocardiopsis flavida]|uniref:Uncharacterized protein n=1 Tax=Murinocardiopsis flavida TaxID=645275 RepID=A0A2P8DUQ9_9ACTN|nr:hypothetical protein [Murinocardiopsis flavida]PSL00952.1 hypothetical protein CLV63_101431 [Murinocardiopsis flavida]